MPETTPILSPRVKLRLRGDRLAVSVWIGRRQVAHVGTIRLDQADHYRARAVLLYRIVAVAELTPLETEAACRDLWKKLDDLIDDLEFKSLVGLLPPGLEPGTQPL